MILETLRIVSDWFAHPTNGINAKLATVQRDAGDAAPTAVALITDETRDFSTAIRKLPDTRPCLTVFLAGDVDLDPEVMTADRNGEVSLIIRYGMNENDTEQGIRDTYYTLRAAMESLRELNRNDNASARVRNGIMVLQMTELMHLSPFQTAEDVVITSALKVTFRVRDTQP